MRYLLIPLFLLLPGCAPVPRPPSSAASSADAAFDRLAQEYISGYLAWRPLTGTSLGLHEYDGKITDFTKPSLAAELARLKSCDQSLANLNTAILSPRAFYDYRILRNSIQREIFGFEQMETYFRNPMTYAGAIDANTYIKRNFAPLEDRVRSLTAILKQAPNIMAAARANLADSLPRPFIETAIDEANGAVDFLDKDLVDALKDVKSPSLMADFNSANSRAMAELSNYVAYLKEQKLPKATDQFALGRDKYQKLLLYGEMITLSPAQLLDLGLQQLQRQQQIFAETANQIDASKRPIEVFKLIQRDHPTEQTLIPDTSQDLEIIRQFIVDRKIIDIPSPVRPKVTETPQYLRATSFASMDTPGPFEAKATEAYYYVSPPEPDWTPQQKEEWLTSFNYYSTDIVSIHEVYPGHYVQFLCLNASPATRLEKIFAGYAFTEGWAHYAEQMMVDQGFGDFCSQHAIRNTQHAASPLSGAAQINAAKYRLAQADEALLRLCRFCVSIKMHCQGMTIDEATKFIQDNCYYEEKAARQEAIRGTYDPEYLYYTLGKLEILKLRDDYRKQQGPNFSLRKFHDELLRHGAPPIRLLREVLLKDRNLWDQVL